MKFNDYLNTDTSVRPVQQGITIRDENRETQLEAEIATLSSQLSTLKTDAQELISLRDTNRTLKSEFKQEQEYRIVAEQKAERAAYQLDIQRNFELEIKNLSAQASSFQEIIQSIKLELNEKERVNTKQEEELLSLTAANGLLQTTQEDLVRKVGFAEDKIAMVNRSKDSLAEMIRKEQDSYNVLVDEKKELSDKYDQILAQKDYLTIVCARLTEELEMERVKVQNLSDSLGLVKISYNTTKHHLNNSSVEAKDLQEQVASLLKTLADNNAHNQYLTEKQKYLEAVLAKPRYTSEASIARNEGFKMPLGGMATNSRKNYLGTGKPTLLKFKKKESTNDNTE